MCICFCSLIRKLLTMPYAALAILAASVVSLLSAFVAQHLFDIQPCILCLFQRVPYAVTLFFAALALAFRDNKKVVKVLFGLIAVTFLVNVGIAAFHSGVERQWWEGTNGCAVTPLNGQLTREQLLSMAVAQCDEINFEIFGLTFANLNVLLCFVLAGFAWVAGFAPQMPEPEGDCGCSCKCRAKK